MHSSANSDPSPYSSKTKLFHIEFSDFHVSKGDSIKPWCDQLKRQLFEAEYLADEDSVFVPADVAAIVHLSQKETLRVRELQAAVRSKVLNLIVIRPAVNSPDPLESLAARANTFLRGKRKRVRPQR